MSELGQTFLDNWIEEFAATSQSAPSDVASLAVEDAADEGIGENELQDTAGGNLNAYITDRLAAAAAQNDEDVETQNGVDVL